MKANNKRPKSRARAKPGAKPRGKPRPKARARSRKPRASSQRTASRWVRFVDKHGVVLASARGPVPSVAEAVAGEPIVGSWWAHKKGRAIFEALSELDDSDDVRCFKLIDGKVTLAHRRVWPALVRLAGDGTLAFESVASLQQEHMPTGEHRNFVTPFPDWVDDATAHAAMGLDPAQAKAMLGDWVDATAKSRKRA